MRVCLRSVARVAAAFFCCILFNTLSAQTADADFSVRIENKPVRVCLYPQNGFYDFKDGKPQSGYGYEYLQHLRRYAPWTYEYVGSNTNWSDALEMLEKGEIDLLPDVRKTPEREAKYLFSEYPIGQSSTILTVRSGNTKYRVGDYGNWNGIRIGIPKSATMEKDMVEFARREGFGYTAVSYAGMDEMIRDLQNGKKIDAALSHNFRRLQNEWLLDQVNVTPSFLIVRKDNPALLAELNTAMEHLELDNPSLCDTMRKQYFSQSEADSVQYTEQERNFIRKMREKEKKFTAVLNPDRYPVMYYADCQPRGLIRDIADEIIRRTGLDIEFKTLRTLEEYQRACKDPEVDFVFDANYRLKEGEERGLILSHPYLSLSAFLLKNRSCKKEPKRYVLVEGAKIENYLDDVLPEGTVVDYCKSMKDAVDLVTNGTYDATCLHTSAAEFAVRNDPTSSLESQLLPKKRINLSVGTRDSRNPLLTSIVNKAVASLGEDFILESIQKYRKSNSEVISLTGLLHRYPFIMFGIPFVLLFAFCVILLCILKMRKNAYRLGVVFKNLPFRYFFADEHGRLLQYDYGDTPNTPRIRTLDDMQDDAVRIPMKKLVTEVIASGVSKEDIYMDSGKTRNCVVAPVSESLFGRRAVIGVSSDITELRNSRDVARKNEEFFRLTLQSIGDGVIATDAHGNVIILNPVAERMIGVKSADAVGKPHTDFFKIFNAADGSELESPVLRTLRTGRMVELANQTELKSLDGKQTWHISDSSSPIQSADGRLFGAILVFRDVTEEYERRKETEAELTNWENIAKIAQVYHFKYDPKTRKVKGNNRIAFAWPLSDGCPIPSEEWIHPDDLAEWKKQYSEIKSGIKRNAIVEFRVKQNGKLRYFRSFMRGSALPDGIITGILQEVTAFVEAKAKQKALHALWSACLDNMPLLLFIKSADDFRYLQCNENFSRFLGKRMEEIIGRNDKELLLRKEDVVALGQHDSLTLASEQALIRHESITDGNGKKRHFMTVKFCAKDLDGNAVLVGMSLDETEEYNRAQTLKNVLEDWENVSKVAGIGTFRLDSDMNILSATDQMTRFWPAGPDGRPIYGKNCLHPDDVDEYYALYKTVFGGEREDASMLCRILRGNNEIQYIRLYIKRNAERRNEVSGLLHDVTPQIQEQRKREALLAMWKNVVNTVPALFYVKNADDQFRLLQVNDKFCAYFDLPHDEIVGRKEHEFISRIEDADRNLREDMLTMERGVRQDYLESIRMNDGTTRHYQTVKIPSKDEEGRRVLISMSQDVTDVQELFEARKIISSAFETLFSSNDLVADMRTIMRNICDFIGFDRAYIACIDEKVNSIKMFSVYRPDGSCPIFDLDTFRIERATTLPWYIKLRESLKNDVFCFDFSDTHDLEAASYHVPAILEKKTECDIRGVHLNYISVEGKPWGCLGFIFCGRPVKKLSAHEANLLKLTAHIVELAITRKRTQDQLQHALDRALAADKAKTFFLSSMSHEIRTPLNAVIGFTDLLKDSDLDAETREDYLTSVSDASHALLTLLNDILELSKLTSHKVQTKPVMTDMNAFVGEMDAMFRPEAVRKALSLDFVLSGVPNLLLDQPHLRQILFNLIGNALKFTRTGGVTVSISFERDEMDFGTLILCVSDTGIGIEEDDREKMFEPFTPLSRMRGTNSSCTGTGLGLAIVKKIVEQEGGTLDLRSEIGKGSTFTITIPNVWLHPKRQPESSDGNDVSLFAGTGMNAPVSAKMPRLLIVDDSEIALEILSRMLTKMNVPHEKASSAKDALIKLEKMPCEILMTDLLMPEMNGAELAQAVRSDSRFSQMRIIAMSTENESIMYDKNLFDKVMLKPIVRNALFDGIFGKD